MAQELFGGSVVPFIEDGSGNRAVPYTSYYQGADGSLTPGASLLPSPGEILLVGPDAGITLAAGATYNSPAVNILGNRTMIGMTDISGLSSDTTYSAQILQQSTKLANQIAYTYSSASDIDYNTVLQNTASGNSGIYTEKTYMSVQAASANTAAMTINGLSIGVA